MELSPRVAPVPRHGWPVIALAIIGIVSALVLARSFLMPVFLAFLLALTFSPIRRFLQRRGVPAAVTAGGLVLLLFVLLAGMVIVLSEPVQNYATDGNRIVADVERKLRGVSETIERVADASDQVEELTKQGSDDSVEVTIEGPGMLSRIAWNAPFVAAQAMFTLVLLFFVVSTGDLFSAKIVEASQTFSDKRRALGILRDIERQISRYFLTITTINAGLGVAVGLALWGLGMPNPLLFGVMAFLLNFIPYIGALVGVVVTFAIGIVSFPTFGGAAAVAMVYLALTTLEGQFITPWAVGRRLSLNPVVVFIAVAFWGWAWSFIGMFIAVPLLIVAMAIAERIPHLERLAIFLSGDRVPDVDKTDEAEERTRLRRRPERALRFRALNA